MAFHAFLKLDGIDGEATDHKHVKWIDIDSFHWGLRHSVDSVGSGLASGKAVTDGFTFNKKTDASSPKLALHCCDGSHIKTATVEVCQHTGDHLNWLTYKLSDVVVSTFRVSGHSAGTDRLEETVEVSFSNFLVTYKPTDAKGGLGGAIPAGWDFKANKKV